MFTVSYLLGLQHSFIFLGINGANVDNQGISLPCHLRHFYYFICHDRTGTYGQSYISTETGCDIIGNMMHQWLLSFNGLSKTGHFINKFFHYSKPAFLNISTKWCVGPQPCPIAKECSMARVTYSLLDCTASFRLRPLAKSAAKEEDKVQPVP